MGDIYQNARVTIAATGSISAIDGLIAERRAISRIPILYDGPGAESETSHFSIYTPDSLAKWKQSKTRHGSVEAGQRRSAFCLATSFTSYLDLSCSNVALEPGRRLMMAMQLTSLKS